MCLFPMIALAQLQPTIGIKYTGGVSYDMERESFSAQIGLNYNFNEDSTFDNVGISGEYIYDWLKMLGSDNNYYVLKLQTANKFSERFSLTYYGGYMNNFNQNVMTSFKGNFKTNFAWGGGIRLNSDYSYAEVLYENLAGYPHISLGLHFKLWSVAK